MQKKLIALAVAGLASSAAFAQSNVTIYGVADAYLASSKTDDAKRQNLVQSGGLATSRLGFKGAEDLGNGLKAIFALEYRLDIDQNFALGGNPTTASSGPARQQLVGLTGGFGTAVAGRLQTTAYDWAVKYDTLAGTAFSPLQNVNGNMLIGATAVAARADNAVAYISPSFGGLTVAVNHAQLTEQTRNVANDNTGATLLGAYYDNGPLSAGLVYASANNHLNARTNRAATQVQDWALGASYDLKVAKLTATYQTEKTGGNGYADITPNHQTARNNAWSLGAAVPVSAKGTVIGSYGANNVKTTAIADNARSWTLAYTHAMSKRTTAYVGYNAVNRGADTASIVTGSAATGQDTSTYVAGVNHKF